MSVQDILTTDGGFWRKYKERYRTDHWRRWDLLIESSHHEVAPAQHEIVFRHSEALSAADDILTFKMVVRTIAKKHGLHATFMPKPKSESAGSGMHLNLTLQKEGRNLFFDEKDPYGLSREAYYFIGGLMKHIGAVSLFTNPIVNSYKRLIPGFDAPIYANWSVKKKSALIRIPFEKEGKKWIELRSPDASANPYLALAVCLAAGMDGIDRKILPPSCIDERNTGDGVRNWKKHAGFRRAFWRRWKRLSKMN